MDEQNRRNQQPDSDIMVKVDGLYYTYADGTQALRGIDLEIKKGEKVAIMGSNGSGKSTFFLNLNGVFRPQKGNISINGKPLDYSKKGLLEVRRQVGIVFQDPDNQLFSASVTQEISFGVLNLGFPKEEVREKVDQIMDELHITEFKDKPTHFLSGGQKKRVAIADVLVMQPSIVILDEPASALDPKHARMIDEIVDELSRSGITVLLSTHDVERALIWADKIVLFDEGKVLKEGKPEEIFFDEALLEKTNLEKPSVLKIYDGLIKEGLLPKGACMPKTAEELITLFVNTK
ncbi:energy-coupling factor ABC transporter ATP-binding protein [Clostridium aminobutyricum]|uniref:ABC transporter ATP-binding protein n=1 Tax=Clostridium aminobutyricum TaxID=33953 RepID=A0A939D6F7_CLOAM|nr:ATP-binding cassette domain-containing protein [Clostridium aminobutyricum]MBN7771901.1 ATP-binding cassette domain-containing protein [Clostridium aminobutyricum]